MKNPNSGLGAFLDISGDVNVILKLSDETSFRHSSISIAECMIGIFAIVVTPAESRRVSEEMEGACV